jgi:sec-independent protein translocase protein TatA
MGSFSIWHWLIVLVVIMLVFGTKKLGNVGSDLGKAIRGFKEGVKGEEENAAASKSEKSTIDIDTKEKKG